MSISPTDANRSNPSSSSSRQSSPNPSSDHGCGRRAPEDQFDRRIGTPSSRRRATGSTEATNLESEEVTYSSGGPSVEIFGERCESSKNVTEHLNPDAKKASNDRDNGTVFKPRASVRGGISSQFRADRYGPKINGNPSETGRVHSENLVTGSSGLQGNPVQSASRRNQPVNANHLLNFQYDPISRPPPRDPPARRQRKIKPYSKDLFLQANYKFVVLDTANYQIGSMDPDKMLQWEDIVCVRYSSPSAVQCPICLESPLCPQMTSCGHIYCFPCILRYLLMGKEDRKGDCWKKCPLCFMMISSKDLLTVQIENVQQFHVGDRAHFALLTRAKDSLVPSLKNQQEPVPKSDSTRDSFSKFILTSDVELSFRDTKSDLSSWLCKAESGLVDDLEMLPYVCAALEQLEERMKNWMEHPALNGTLPSGSFSSHKVANTAYKRESNSLNSISSANRVNSKAFEQGGRMSTSSFKSEISDVSGNMACERSPMPLSASPESFGSPEKVIISYDEDRGSRSSSLKDVNERDSYAFYQATDGQHLILHPLNMKCLLHHYGSYDLLPPRVSGEILEMEIVTQSEAMRRRYRYLSHFSLTTALQLCEIDLSEILPPSSLAPFSEELKKRKKQRQRLAKKEQNEKARAEAAAVLDMRVVPYDHFRSSHTDVTFSLDDFEALGSSSVPSTSPLNTERKLFSDVTRLGYASAYDSPSLKADGSANSSGNIEKIGEASNAQGSRPSATLSFASVMSVPQSAGSPTIHNANGLGKKGKKPTKVLLSTAGGRRY